MSATEPTITVTGSNSGQAYSVPLSVAKTVHTNFYGGTSFHSSERIPRTSGKLTYPARDISIRESKDTVLSLIASAEAKEAERRAYIDATLSNLATAALAPKPSFALTETQLKADPRPEPEPEPEPDPIDLDALVIALDEHADASSEFAEAIQALKDAQDAAEAAAKALDDSNAVLKRLIGG